MMRIFIAVILSFVVLGCSEQIPELNHLSPLTHKIPPVPIPEKHYGISAPLVSPCPEIDTEGDLIIEAEFKGGKKALNKFIQQNFNLPTGCVLKDSLWVVVDIDTFGNVTKFRLLNKVDFCLPIEDSIAAMMQKMPQWIPAYDLDSNCNKIKNCYGSKAFRVWK